MVTLGGQMGYSKKQLEKLETSRVVTRRLMKILDAAGRNSYKPVSIQDLITVLFDAEIIDYTDEDLLERLYYPKKEDK